MRGAAARDLAKHQSTSHDVDHGQFGDDSMNHAEAGQRQGARRDDFRFPVSRCVLHRHDHPPRTCDQVHGATHALDHLPGHHPVREVAIHINLQGAKNRDVDVSTANHGE